MNDLVSLKEWLDNHYISYSLRKDILVIPGFGRCLIQADYDHIFRTLPNGEVSFNPIENIAYLLADEIFYIVFPFGNRWFYVDIREDMTEVQFNVLRYVGEPLKDDYQCSFYPLGIHTSYELLNGSGSLKDWCKKAKFLGYNGIGVTDRNTLACSLDLQYSAQDNNLKFCFGYSLSIRVGSDKIGAKIYSSSQDGFKHLLRIQKAVCVDSNEKVIEMVDLLNLAKGNSLVFDKWSGIWLSNHKKDILPDFIEAFDGWVFYQVDTTEYRADRFDASLLNNLKAYFDNFYLGGLEYDQNVRPILIQDVYYLDKEDWRNKVVLNKIDSGAAHEQSYHQYLKPLEELYCEFRGLFSDKYGDEVFFDMCEATADIIENANAEYDLTENYAPKYDMTPQEKEKYKTTLNMFHKLIEDGFKKYVPEGEEELYRERLEYEKYVIESTDNIDYILIQRDEINWALQNGILSGVRGSACGSLLLYLLNITLVDPIKYNLMFERFLLPERGGLEAMEVTKLAPKIESTEYVEILLEDGKVLQFDKDAEFIVCRNNEKIVVYADELAEGDDIIWDRRDQLHYL